MTAITHGSLGMGTSLVGNPGSTTIANKSLVAGDYISLGSDADSVTINAEQYQTIEDVCIVAKSTDSNVSTGSNVLINFDVEMYDPSGMHDNMTNPSRVNILTDGLYLLQAQAMLSADASTAGAFYISIYLQRGADQYIVSQQGQPGVASTIQRISVCHVIQLYQNDYLFIRVSNDTGVAKTVLTFPNPVVNDVYRSPFLAVTKIGNF